MRAEHKIPIIFFYCISFIFWSCSNGLNPTKNRIFVVEEISLREGRTLFWFRDEKQLMHEGLSYFQITSDRCSLSTNKANAYCSQPIQLYEIKSDTIFILSHSEIVSTMPDSKYVFKMVNYSLERYDLGKRPVKARQYFLDSLCSQNSKK